MSLLFASCSRAVGGTDAPLAPEAAETPFFQFVEGAGPVLQRVRHRLGATGRLHGFADRSAFVTVSPGVGGAVIFKNKGTPTFENGGGAGCTPGFRRQPQHFEYWVGYAPGDSFADVFGVDRSGTLLDNVTARGGGENALARHAVAALLNASNSEVDYDMSVAEIIAAVQSAFASGDFETVKNQFEAFNEQGCTVDKSN